MPRIKIRRDQVLARLRLAEDRETAERVRRLYPSLLLELRRSCRPVWCYCLMPNDLATAKATAGLAPGLADLLPCKKLAVGFATLGPGPDRVIQAAFDRQAYLEGYLLNQLADELLFAGSAALDRAVLARLEKMGLGATRKYAAGEGGLPWAWQGQLLAALKAQGEVPARLNAQSVLWPARSLLYFFGADQGLRGQKQQSSCTFCAAGDCLYRQRSL